MNIPNFQSLLFVNISLSIRVLLLSSRLGWRRFPHSTQSWAPTVPGQGNSASTEVILPHIEHFSFIPALPADCSPSALRLFAAHRSISIPSQQSFIKKYYPPTSSPSSVYFSFIHPLKLPYSSSTFPPMGTDLEVNFTLSGQGRSLLSLHPGFVSVAVPSGSPSQSPWWGPPVPTSSDRPHPLSQHVFPQLTPSWHCQLSIPYLHSYHLFHFSFSFFLLVFHCIVTFSVVLIFTAMLY